MHKLEPWTQTEVHFAHVPRSNCSELHPAPEEQKPSYSNTPELCMYLQAFFTQPSAFCCDGHQGISLSQHTLWSKS